MKKMLFFVFLLAVSALFTKSVQAAPVYNNISGTYTDNLSDSTGFGSLSNISIASNTLKLASSTGSYATSGIAITNPIAPPLIAKWGIVTASATLPAGTSLKIQVLDGSGNVYPDSILPGNSSGFATTTLDISTLLVDMTADLTQQTKCGALEFKLTLTTNSTSTTPSVDSLFFAWSLTQGDVSSSTIATTAWPKSLTYGGSGNNQSSNYSGSTLVPYYPAIIWSHANNSFPLNAGSTISGMQNNVYELLEGGADGSNASLNSISRTDGSLLWQREMSTWSYVNTDMILTQNNTIYTSDIFNDVLKAYDVTATGTPATLKWMYNFYGGHGNEDVAIGGDGTIYTVRSLSDNTHWQIYAFNPDGSVKWQTAIYDATSSVLMSGLSIGLDGKIYLVIDYTAGGGYLAAFNSDGSLAWKYVDLASSSATPISPIIDSDGTIYTADTSYNLGTKKIYAINLSGTLKWSYVLGTSTTASYRNIALGPNDTIFAITTDGSYPTVGGLLQKFNTTNGDLLSSIPISLVQGSVGFDNFIADLDGGVVLNGAIYSSTTTIAYYDSSLNQKWRLTKNNGDYSYFLGMIQDESGIIYSQYADRTVINNRIIAIAPWTLIASAGTDHVINTAFTLSVTTSMQPTNLLTGGSNQIQAILSDGTKVPLAYASTNGDGTTVWTANIPADSSYGSKTITIEASQANITTDINTNFATPATGSNNTGITTTVSYQVTSPVGGHYYGPYNFYNSSPETTSSSSPTTSTSTSTSIISSSTVSVPVTQEQIRNTITLLRQQLLILLQRLLAVLMGELGAIH
jgi:hypothetical protein